MNDVLQRLTQPGSPSRHLFEAAPAALEALRHDLIARSPDAIVRVVRGRKAQRAPALFDELAAALQLPLYFGGNWSALQDCLRDLTAPLVLLVSDAAEL